MKAKNFYKKLSERVRDKLLQKMNIANNDEFISLVFNAPKAVITEHFGIPESILSEIKQTVHFESYFQNSYQNRFGYTPEIDDDLTFGRTSDSQAIRSKIIDQVPSKISLCKFYKVVQDQGNVGSCVGFGVEGALRSAIDFKFPMSPGFAYKVAKRVDGNENEGTTLNSCIKGILKYGIPKEELYPYHPDKMFQDIPAKVIREAKNIRLIRYEDQKESDLNLIEWLIGCLSGMLFDMPLAVAIGVLVFRSCWNSAQRDGKLPEPYPGESPDGGHSVTFVGYNFDSTFPGGGFFIFRNSHGKYWGRDEKWCPAGYGIMSFQHAVRYIKSAVVGVDMSVKNQEKEAIIPDVVKTTSTEEVIPLLASNEKCTESKLHKIYSGITGSGKTTKLKADILASKKKRFAILDVHGDISGDDNTFVQKANAKLWDIIKHGLPYNVLELMGEVDSSLTEEKVRILKTEWLLGCFKACIPDLGSRQLSMLRDEIEQQVFAYHSLNRKDMQLSGILHSIEKKRAMSGSKGRIAESLADQLRPVFKLGLLDCNHSYSLLELLKKNETIIFKCKVPGEMDHVLKLISVFLVSGIFSVYRFSDLGKSQTGVIVQDEFHLMPKHPVWEKITREGRKFGIELWASSQNIEEMKNLLSNVGQRNIFRVASGTEARVVANMLGWDTKHKKEIVKVLAELENYEFFDPVDVPYE